MEKKKTALGRRLLLVFLGVLLGVSVYLANARSLARNQLPMPFGTGIAVVLSGSMEPTLKVGDLIAVRQADQYQKGDIIVYKSTHELIVHRVIETDGQTFITQGDANNSKDAPIDLEAVQGKVVCRIPAAGYLINYLRTPVGIFLILILAIALIEGSFQKEKKNDSEEIEAIKEEIRRLKEEQMEKEKNERK